MTHRTYDPDNRVRDVTRVGALSARVRDLVLVYSIEVDEEMASFIDQYAVSLEHDAELADLDDDPERLQLIVEDVHELLTSTEERIARARRDFDAARR